MDFSVLNAGALYPTNNISPSRSGNEVEANKGIKSFSDLLQDKLTEVNTLQKQADKLTEDFLVGEPVEIHQLMLAMEKADLALREMVEIRNKLIEAYKEISHMQV